MLSGSVSRSKARVKVKGQRLNETISNKTIGYFEVLLMYFKVL